MSIMDDGIAFEDDGRTRKGKMAGRSMVGPSVVTRADAGSNPALPATPFDGSGTPPPFELQPPGPPRRAGKPYVWVTWITPLLAGDDHCEWATWFRAHYKAEKRPRTGGDLSSWKAAHDRQVQMSLMRLKAEGYTCTLEAQNDVKVQGDRGILAGKPDIIAVSPTDEYGLIVDEKTGRRKDSDFWQVLIYMLFVPQALKEYAGLQFRGRINYASGPAWDITPADLTAENVKHIHGACRRVMDEVAAIKVPSRGECNYCDVRPQDCPENLVGAAEQRATTKGF